MIGNGERPAIRVLLVDDHIVAREGLRAMLKRNHEFVVVGEASDGLEAISQYDSLKPDVVLLDLRMPRLGGHEFLERMMNRSPRPRIVVMTTYDGDEHLRRAIKAGAAGYLLKDTSRQEVWDTIRKVFAGQTVVAPSLLDTLTQAVSEEHLTTREREVLQLMAKGLSNKEIGNSLFVSEGTAKTHVNAILAKLKAMSRTEAVVIASRRGLVNLSS